MDFDTLFNDAVLEKAIEAAISADDAIAGVEIATETLQQASILKQLLKPMVEPLIDQLQ